MGGCGGHVIAGRISVRWAGEGVVDSGVLGDEPVLVDVAVPAGGPPADEDGGDLEGLAGGEGGGEAVLGRGRSGRRCEQDTEWPARGRRGAGAAMGEFGLEELECGEWVWRDPKRALVPVGSVSRVAGRFARGDRAVAGLFEKRVDGVGGNDEDVTVVHVEQAAR